METRTLGGFGPVSVLALGGGGLGKLWGPTTREEAIATARLAVDRGITLLDMAPRYGDGEAELVIGEAFEGRLPDGVRITTKCLLGDTAPAEIESRLRQSIEESPNGFGWNGSTCSFCIQTSARMRDRSAPTPSPHLG